MALGLGALPQKSPLFGDLDSGWPNPYSFTDRWRDAVKSRKLPKVTSFMRFGIATPQR